jgi:hypothetical protein
MKLFKLKVWGVTNLGGEKLIWGSYRERKVRMPLFPDKGAAIAEKARLDAEKPSPNESKFRRFVVPVSLTYPAPEKKVIAAHRTQ